MGDAVNFKGNKDGIVLLLDCSVEFETLCQMIVQKLWQSRSFFREHTTLIVNSGDVCLTDGQQLAMKVLLQSLGHDVKYFLPEKPTAETIAVQNTAAPVENVAKETASTTVVQQDLARKTVLPPELTEVEHYLAEGALAIRKNVRSGQKISYDGTLLIFGDVNAGAELVATGHIIVLGTLRG